MPASPSPAGSPASPAGGSPSGPSPASPSATGSTTSNKKRKYRNPGPDIPNVIDGKDGYNDLVAGAGNKWDKDLKSADTKKPDEKATKGNELINNFDYKTHSGIKYDEHVENKADLTRVDIDCTNINNRVYALGGALTPIYNVALTKDTIKDIIEEGFLVREANGTKVYYVDTDNSVKLK